MYSKFLAESHYVDFSSPNIQEKAYELFLGIDNDVEKAKIAYEYVRDEISHSFDVEAKIITAKASDVLKHHTGICHAKANLLVALLRSKGIPSGFCFQRLTLAEDDSLGYCVHCYTAIFVDSRWVMVDARGNMNGKNAQFCLDKPQLAFSNRENYDEYFWEGIYAQPYMDTMRILEKSCCVQDIRDSIPDYVNEKPDLII